MLFISLEMRHQPFFGWIKDLSDKDPTSIFNLFGLDSLGSSKFFNYWYLANINGCFNVGSAKT